MVKPMQTCLALSSSSLILHGLFASFTTLYWYHHQWLQLFSRHDMRYPVPGRLECFNRNLLTSSGDITWAELDIKERVQAWLSFHSMLSCNGQIKLVHYLWVFEYTFGSGAIVLRINYWMSFLSLDVARF